MPLIINELGEFVEPDPPDRDERRERIYASCIRVDPSRFKREIDEEPFEETVYPTGRCEECGETFSVTTPNKRFCSVPCRVAYNNRKRRKK